MQTSQLTATFLGTGTSFGVPQIGCKCEVCTSKNPKDNRLRSSIKIEVDNNTFIIDAGPDFRTQVLRESTPEITDVLLTHEHRDHVGGLDDLRAYNQLTNKPVQVYAMKRTVENVEHDYGYFSNINYPGIPKINLNIIDNQYFAINNTKILPILVMHNKLPIFGYRINDLTYITDASYISEEELEKIKGSKILIVNALRIEPYFSHFNLMEALKIVEKINPEKAYFTHINHQMGLHNQVNEQLPTNVQLAFDGLKVSL